MSLILKKKFILTFICAIVFNLFSFSQQGSVIINKDPRIDELIKLKKEIDDTSNRYRIQIYSGNRTSAEKTQMDFKINFSKYSTKLIYETPNYKIWVGNFRTRLEAERAHVKIKRKFASAFIFKPQGN